MLKFRTGAYAVAMGACLVLMSCAPRSSERPYAPGDGPPRPVPAAAAPADAGLIDAPIDGQTRSRIARAAGAGVAACAASLGAARVTFDPVPDRVDSATCGLSQAGVLAVDLGTVARLAPAAPTMTCETALAFSVWRRQSVEPAAREIFGQDVVQIDHFGTYACRSVSNRPGARPSAHSLAAAIDFGGVRLRDGRRITVAADWRGDTDEARFLRRIRDDACRIFGTVLSPDYDAPHQDHLHLEPGARPFCR